MRCGEDHQVVFCCAVLTDSARLAKRDDAARRSDGAGNFQSVGAAEGQPASSFKLPALAGAALAVLLAHAQALR